MSNLNTILVLVYADWCGHCIKYKEKQGNNPSQWETIKEGLRNKDMGDIKLSILELEEKQLKKDKKLSDVSERINTAIKQELIDFKKIESCVEGFPTLLILNKQDGIFVPAKKSFNGNRTKLEDILNYIKECKQDCNNTDNNQKGGRQPNYRNKYKKYKKLYIDLLQKNNK